MGTSRRFVEEYTSGLDTESLGRLFRRDASRAYSVLTREQAAEPEPAGSVARFLYRLKIVFLGLSYKLTPARRVLFAIGLASGLFGLLFVHVVRVGGMRIEYSPLWFLVSIGSLVFLLALELVDRVLVRDEIEVAQQLQRQLLPQTEPEIPGYEVKHSYRTANDIGGDFYDFLPLPDGRLALVIGDASGHGMAAGLLMAIANATLKLALDLDPSPANVAHLINRALYRTSDRRAFVTLFYGLLTPGSGELEYVCAGHPYPLLRRGDGNIEELGTGALPLGLREEVGLTPMRTTVKPGDLLLLYTDGLPEAVTEAGADFGFERLKLLLSHGGTAPEVYRRVLDAFLAFLGENSVLDDVSLVALSRLGPPPPPPPLPPIPVATEG